MNEEKAVKDGLKKVLEDMKQSQKVIDLNKGFNDGVKRGKDWVMTMMLIISFIAFSVVMTATLITVGKVDGRSQAQDESILMQQKVIIDEIALMKIKHEKLSNEVKKK